MARCERCGNEYDKTFDVVTNGETHTFDCFECAIATLAPECGNCGVKVVGHGVEADDTIYCSSHCGEQAGVSGLNDRV
jgi:hypothetical protein